jgi:hypothetical protein
VLNRFTASQTAQKEAAAYEASDENRLKKKKGFLQVSSFCKEKCRKK